MQIHFIIYVSSPEKSKHLYAEILQQKPSLDVPGMTEFDLAINCKLGIMPIQGIEKIICPTLPSPSFAPKVPKCELYFVVKHAEQSIQKAIQAGATLIDPFQKRDWGHSVAYLSDMDAHVIAIAEQIRH